MSSDPNKKVKVLFTCLDWRLHPQVEEFFTKDGVACDMCITAGSVKDLIDPLTREFFLKQIDISKRLHNCQAVILTMHMDCGAYGGSKAYDGLDAEIAGCTDELKKTKAIVEERFPGLPVETYIIDLEHAQNGWNIAPEAVEI
ncbi:MAG: hypothetical protein MUD10_02755 [Candidatus Pacebacteria bacterium]|jgi:hypothetical protein|nr:hypothetical protein [Candidatus Paceibacterota bacterium]